MPALRRGDVVIFDNLTSHLSPAVSEAIERAGASVLPLPPYSPDFNPIEEMFSKFKEFLRRVGARAKEHLYDAIGEGLREVTPGDILGWFRHAGCVSCRREPLDVNMRTVSPHSLHAPLRALLAPCRAANRSGPRRVVRVPHARNASRAGPPGSVVEDVPQFERPRERVARRGADLETRGRSSSVRTGRCRASGTVDVQGHRRESRDEGRSATGFALSVAFTASKESSRRRSGRQVPDPRIRYSDSRPKRNPTPRRPGVADAPERPPSSSSDPMRSSVLPVGGLSPREKAQRAGDRPRTRHEAPPCPKRVDVDPISIQG